MVYWSSVKGCENNLRKSRKAIVNSQVREISVQSRNGIEETMSDLTLPSSHNDKGGGGVRRHIQSCKILLL